MIGLYDIFRYMAHLSKNKLFKKALYILYGTNIVNILIFDWIFFVFIWFIL